jgi:hypothetical protein
VECHLTLSFLRLLPHPPSVRFGPFPFGLDVRSGSILGWTHSGVQLASELCTSVYRFDFLFPCHDLRIAVLSPLRKVPACHTQSLAFGARIGPFMYCLGTLVLDRLASYSTHGIPLTTRIHRSKVWRRATRKAVPERSGITRQSQEGWASSTRVAFAVHLGRGMLYEQATYRVGVIRLCNPGHVQIAFVRF